MKDRGAESEMCWLKWRRTDGIAIAWRFSGHVLMWPWSSMNTRMEAELDAKGERGGCMIIKKNKLMIISMWIYIHQIYSVTNMVY